MIYFHCTILNLHWFDNERSGNIFQVEFAVLFSGSSYELHGRMNYKHVSVPYRINNNKKC